MVLKLRGWASSHPKLTAWIALAIGMVIVLVIAARDVGLIWNQWLFLILATVGLAGLCVWIIGWESGEDEPVEEDTAKKEAPAKDAAAPKTSA